MSDRKNIKIDAELFDRLKADKGTRRSWPQYFEDVLAERDDDNDGAVYQSLRTIEKRVGRIERTLEQLGGR